MIYLFAISFIILLISITCLTSYGIVFLLNYLNISFESVLLTVLISFIAILLCVIIEALKERPRFQRKM